MTPRRAVVVSPTPPYPADHGHRNRVRQTTRLLGAAGYLVDFVLYPMDNDWQGAIPGEISKMPGRWLGRFGGSVTIVPPTRKLHAPPLGEEHALDEWWDPVLDSHLDFLCRRRAYDVMLVNYVFLSRAFLHAHQGCRRVLDTHDRLSGRHALFERHGAVPEFFFTTEADEARGLLRADIVLAIKPSEAAFFRGITDREVISLPFCPPRRAPAAMAASDPRERRPAAPLRVGFIGADNNVNAINLAAFLRRLAAWRGLYLPHLQVVIAGNVCRRVTPAPSFVRLLGRVEDAATFYGAVDLIVAPLEFSTGLKIKVAEALAWSMPIVATADAFDGFAPADPFHTLPDIEAVCAALMALAADPARLAVLTRATRRAAAAARSAATRGAAEWRAALAGSSRTLCVVTDHDVAERPTLAAERCAQAIAYFSSLMNVVVQAAGFAKDVAPAEPVHIWTDLRAAPPKNAPPPLRHLPAVLDWTSPPDRPISVLVIVETSLFQAETDAREALLRAVRLVSAGCRLAVVRGTDLPRDPRFLVTLAALPGPHAVIGIDLAGEARELVACLAQLAGAAFFGLGDRYPLLVEGSGPSLIRHVREHVGAIGHWLQNRRPICATTATGDAGWSRLWARLAAEARTDRISALQGSRASAT